MALSKPTSKKWTRADAEKALAHWSRSGMSLKAYSLSLGLHGQRLSWWRRSLGWHLSQPKRRAGAAPVFVPGVLRRADHARDYGDIGEAKIVFKLVSGIHIELCDPSAASPEWLAAVAFELGGAGR